MNFLSFTFFIFIIFTAGANAHSSLDQHEIIHVFPTIESKYIKSKKSNYTMGVLKKNYINSNKKKQVNQNN